MNTEDREQQRIGSRIKAFREAEGWRQNELARRAAVSRSYISQIENGSRSVSFDVIIRIARAFNMSLAQLVGTDEESPVVPGYVWDDLPVTEEGWRTLQAFLRLQKELRQE